MQKWEYKTLLRSRGFKAKEKDIPWHRPGDWNDGLEELANLGEEGWELVAVTSRSSYLGGTGDYSRYAHIPTDYAGYTSDELWVFKRLKP